MYQRETLTLSSVAPDLVPQDAPRDVWNEARNVYFRNGESLRAIGDTPTLQGTTGTPETCVFLRISGQGFWVYATNDAVFVHDGSTFYDITPPDVWNIGTDAATFTSCVLGGVAYINASDRAPVYWAGDIAEKAKPLDDWPENGRCIALRAHKSFLFAVGMLSDSENGQVVRWSDAVEPGAVVDTWNPAPDNLAGFVILAPLASPCLDALTLRDTFMVYKNESVFGLDFIGGNEVFAARKLFNESGIASTNAVTAFGDQHLFVDAVGDVKLTDGVRNQSVLDGRAQRRFYAAFTQNLAGRFSAVTLARESLSLVIYPTTDDRFGNQALVYDHTSQAIGFRDMPNVRCAAEGSALSDVGNANKWSGQVGSWANVNRSWDNDFRAASLDDVIIGGAFGFAVASANANDFIDGEVNAALSKLGLSFGNAQARKMISRVWPKMSGDVGDVIIFRVSGQEITGGPVNLGPELPFVIGQDYPIHCMVQGRFLGLEVRSTGGGAWRLGSIDVEYREVGGW